MSTSFPEDRSSPSLHGVKITTNVDFTPCRILWVGTAGTATLTTSVGTVMTDFPLKEGPNPIGCKKVVFGTASDVWALY